MTTRCIVCDSINTKPLYNGIHKCQKCGHVFADLNLSDKELYGLYSKNYFFGDEYKDYLKDKGVFQKNFKRRLKTLGSFLDPIRHNHLLEIGCAYGFFLDVAREQFNTVLGIDIVEEGIRHANEQLGLKAINADFLKYDFGNRKFDVVCMWDTIEHLQNPNMYLKKLSRHMERGAVIAITTCDIESLNARLRKKRWRLIHPPTHIHYFSKNTLAKILYNNGFDIIYNRYCGFYRSIDNITYNMLVLHKGRLWLYNLLCKSGLNKFNLYLNLYDIMYVIACKR